MSTSLRIFRAARWGLVVLLAVLAASWLCLYIDSVYQRRRAEHLISDLKSFPFATAGFPEVRELVNRNGGHSVQSFPLLPFLPPGPPMAGLGSAKDSESEIAPGVLKRANCTPEDCDFYIWIRPRVEKLPMGYRTSLLLASVLADIGLRPWAIYVSFEIKDGKLRESRTTVGQFRHGTIGSFKGLVPLEYHVITKYHSNGPYGYGVGRPDYSGGSWNELQTLFDQTPDAPADRAFDVRLRCFTRVTSACRGFVELTPTAWADYQARRGWYRK